MEETQRKRRNDSATESNEAYEKKQRVEQLIGALSKPAKKLSSSSSIDSIDTKLCIEQPDDEEENVDVVTSSPPSPVLMTSSQNHDIIKPESMDAPLSPMKLKPESAEKLSTSSPTASSTNTKPIAKVVHFSPKIIQVEKPVFTDKPSARSTRAAAKNAAKKSMFSPPIPPVSTANIYKEAPRQLTRVPRDTNIPLIVYNPPKSKTTSSLTSSAPSVIPIAPITTAPGNVILQASIYHAGNPHQPPTLIPASQLKKMAKQTTTKSRGKQGRDKKPMIAPLPYVTHAMVSPPFISVQPQPPAPLKIKEEPRDTNHNNDEHPSFLQADFRQWSVEQVYQHFLNSDCSKYADIFREQEIDGKALLHLDEMNISKLLNVKMGPAIKLSAIIKELKNP
ncbi:scm-like with four MBT domains protein 2 [Clytia hemisphaerica]|uniref:scm-like with four MBT domains protein 2 n=1 Tax=Clytia hemisphaerica TaxID=252671 RepID=UPI0034D47567